MGFMNIITLIVLVFLLFIWKMVVVIPMREVGLKERLGKFKKELKPGFHFLFLLLIGQPIVMRLREQVLDIPSQSCITRDNVQVEVDGVVYLKVMDAAKASYGIGDYYNASISLAQTTMRSEIGKMDLDDTFSEREHINEILLVKLTRPQTHGALRYSV